MEYLLLCIFTIIHVKIDPFCAHRFDKCEGDFFRDIHHVCEHRHVGVKYIDEGYFGYDECVAFVDRVDVEERDDCIVFIDYVRGEFSIDDFGENCCHGCNGIKLSLLCKTRNLGHSCFA